LKGSPYGERSENGGRPYLWSKVPWLLPSAMVWGNTVKVAVAPKALETFKQRIKEITRRVGGRSMEQVVEQLRTYMPGWKAYFQLANTPAIFKDLDSWLRHRLRAV
jgi:hypothetical protein